jgi:hypothetical protein
MLEACGFVDIKVDLKEESKDFIKDWLPGSGCEDYVVSAAITGRKPGSCSTASPSTDSASTTAPNDSASSSTDMQAMAAQWSSLLARMPEPQQGGFELAQDDAG